MIVLQIVRQRRVHAENKVLPGLYVLEGNRQSGVKGVALKSFSKLISPLKKSFNITIINPAS